MGVLNGFWHWVFDKHPPQPPRPDHVVELAWLPLWKAQLLLHHLWECGIPTTMSEDHTSQLRFGAREPMAHLYVMEVRQAAALAALAELESRSPDAVAEEPVDEL
jgi:hypothetical protein